MVKYSEKISEFLDFLNERFGVFLDSTHGFLLNHKDLLQNQQWSQQRLGISIEQLDQAYIIRSNHPPSPDLQECARREKHRMTQGAYKRNNERGGLNHRIALEDCLCAIFNKWDEFKVHVLQKKGMADKQIMPIMDYLKAVRDRLTHHKDIPQEGKFVYSYNLKYLQYTLPSFSKDQRIELSSDDLDAIVEELRGWIQATLPN